MDARTVPVLACALFVASCATERAGAPVQPARSVQFESHIRPILEAKCSPCHFPGGTMYARLPFDRPETIRVLGTELFTRLKDEGDQAIVRAFLESPPPPVP